MPLRGLQNFLGFLAPEEIQAERTTLLALSTMSMDAAPGTFVVASPGHDGQYLPDYTEVFDKDGSLGRVDRGRAPCNGINTAAATAIDLVNDAARNAGRPIVTLEWAPFQSAAGGRRQAGGPGSDSHANGREFAAYLRAWHDKGPFGMVATVTDSMRDVHGGISSNAHQQLH